MESGAKGAPLTPLTRSARRRVKGYRRCALRWQTVELAQALRGARRREVGSSGGFAPEQSMGAVRAVQNPAHGDQPTAHGGAWLHLGTGWGPRQHPSRPPQGRSSSPPALGEAGLRSRCQTHCPPCPKFVSNNLWTQCSVLFDGFSVDLSTDRPNIARGVPWGGTDGTGTGGSAGADLSAASAHDAQNCDTLCHRVTQSDTYVCNREDEREGPRSRPSTAQSRTPEAHARGGARARHA